MLFQYHQRRDTASKRWKVTCQQYQNVREIFYATTDTEGNFDNSLNLAVVGTISRVHTVVIELRSIDVSSSVKVVRIASEQIAISIQGESKRSRYFSYYFCPLSSTTDVFPEN